MSSEVRSEPNMIVHAKNNIGDPRSEYRLRALASRAIEIDDIRYDLPDLARSVWSAWRSLQPGRRNSWASQRRCWLCLRWKDFRNRPLASKVGQRLDISCSIDVTSHYFASKLGLPLVCFKRGSASPLPVAEEVSSKFQVSHPVRQECFAKGCVFALEGRSRCGPDCQTRWLTWPGHSDSLLDISWRANEWS